MSSNNTLITEIIQTVFSTILIGGLVYGIVRNETTMLKEENYRLKEELYHALYEFNHQNINNEEEDPALTYQAAKDDFEQKIANNKQPQKNIYHDNIINIVILGNKGSGKTSLANNLLYNRGGYSSEYVPTKGYSIFETYRNNLRLWDLDCTDENALNVALKHATHIVMAMSCQEDLEFCERIEKELCHKCDNGIPKIMYIITKYDTHEAQLLEKHFIACAEELKKKLSESIENPPIIKSESTELNYGLSAELIEMRRVAVRESSIELLYGNFPSKYEKVSIISGVGLKSIREIYNDNYLYGI